MNHYVAMFLFMLFAGLLSTMNMWANQWDDIRWSVNDLYMILVMTGWMFFFMGIHDRRASVVLVGLGMVLVGMIAIRTQFLVDTKQYIMGMIPHHSMAVQMSRRLQEKASQGSQDTDPAMTEFLQQLIQTQEEEIRWMKEQV